MAVPGWFDIQVGRSTTRGPSDDRSTEEITPLEYGPDVRWRKCFTRMCPACGAPYWW